MSFDIKYYGNWGGPGHGRDGDPPIDRLDGAFMRHDKSYEKNGYFDLPSDVVLKTEATLAILDPSSTWAARAAGAGAIGIFSALTPVSITATVLVNPAIDFVDDLINQDPVTAAKNMAVNLVVEPIQTVGDFLSDLF